jgi:hypothetical protein
LFQYGHISIGLLKIGKHLLLKTCNILIEQGHTEYAFMGKMSIECALSYMRLICYLMHADSIDSMLLK